MIIIPTATALLFLSSCGGSSDRQMETSQETVVSSPAADTPNALTNPADSVMLQGDTGRQPVANDPRR